MDWTDEKVELLKRLHLEGLSCSQIAGRMGHGLTRNAVIGKVARLHLSNGRQPTISNRSEGQKRRKKRDWSVNLAQAVAGSYEPEAASLAESALAEPPPIDFDFKPQLPAIQKERAEPRPSLRPLVPPTPSGKVTILELTEKICKWPIGQVGDADFHFCGADKPDDQSLPYCDYHANIARQPKGTKLPIPPDMQRRIKGGF